MGNQTVACPHSTPSAQVYDSKGKRKLIEPDRIQAERPSKKAITKQHKLTEFGETMLKRMVSVSTNGGITNGIEIEGFLVDYQTLPVRIVCVCHGNCFTPSEFVKHASGREVPNPMQLIKVCGDFTP